MFRLQGSVLKQIGEVFEEDWFYAGGDQLSAKIYSDSQSGKSSCRVISDGPGVHLDILAKILISAISNARSSIYIVTPYFLPPRELIVAIQSAALRGVEVTILLPSNNNLPYVHWAMRNSLWQFLQFGVRVYYQQAPFDHSKLFVIDQQYCQIGSANFDSRSLRLNFELNVEIFDPEFGQSLCEKIEKDKQNATEITEEQLADRSFPVRIWDAFWWLFTPYL
jgi:cardiolipin synthase